MRTGADALRSMHRYVWKTLEDDVPPPFRGEGRDWEVRYWGTEGEFRFPFVRVAATTPVSYTGSAVMRDAARTFAIHAYPVPMDDPEASIMEAERVEELFVVAFETGFAYIDKPDANDPSTWQTVRSAPHRVPLYDYDGLPLEGAASVSYSRGPSDYLRVTTCSINRIVDPEDDRFWLIVVEPRVTWRRRGRVPTDAGQLVQEVRVTEVPT